jgi:hypothetical protein
MSRHYDRKQRIHKQYKEMRIVVFFPESLDGVTVTGICSYFDCCWREQRILRYYSCEELHRFCVHNGPSNDWRSLPGGGSLSGCIFKELTSVEVAEIMEIPHGTASSFGSVFLLKAMKHFRSEISIHGS